MCPSARVPSGSSASGESVLKPGEYRSSCSFHESGWHRKPPAVDWRWITGCVGLLLRIHVPAPEPCQLRSQILAATVTWQSPAFCEAPSPGRICVRWKKAICMTGINTGRQATFLVIFAAINRRTFFWLARPELRSATTLQLRCTAWWRRENAASFDSSAI